jgi:hypothetical protein
MVRPSVEYCITGCLEEGEKYDQNIHNHGTTPGARAKGFYSPEEILAMEAEAMHRGILSTVQLNLCFYNENNEQESVELFNKSRSYNLKEAILGSRGLDPRIYTVDMYFGENLINAVNTFEELEITSGTLIHVCVKKHGQTDAEARFDAWKNYFFGGLEGYVPV